MTAGLPPTDVVIENFIDNQLYFLTSSVALLRDLHVVVAADNPPPGALDDIARIIAACTTHGRVLLELRQQRGAP
jgi:hypothetical protein